MKRRNFIKMLGLTPLMGILGCKKKPLSETEFGRIDGVRWISAPLQMTTYSTGKLKTVTWPVEPLTEGKVPPVADPDISKWRKWRCVAD